MGFFVSTVAIRHTLRHFTVITADGCCRKRELKGRIWYSKQNFFNICQHVSRFVLQRTVTCTKKSNKIITTHESYCIFHQLRKLLHETCPISVKNEILCIDFIFDPIAIGVTWMTVMQCNNSDIDLYSVSVVAPEMLADVQVTVTYTTLNKWVFSLRVDYM